MEYPPVHYCDECNCSPCVCCDYDECDYDESDDCWNCGGEGFVSNCFTEYACIYPDEGCDECTRRCEICNPVKLTPEQEAERAALRQVLANALAPIGEP